MAIFGMQGKNTTAQDNHPSSVQDRSTLWCGRAEELQLLDKTWAHSPSNLLLLHAPPGTGKTALLTHWLQSENASGHACKPPHHWVFPTAGGQQDRQAHHGWVREFLDTLLHRLGVTHAENLTGREKAVLLAERLQQQDSCLIIENFPAKLITVNSITGMYSPCLYEFLRRMAVGKQGKCILLSDEEIIFTYEIAPHVHVIRLGELTAADGAELLRLQGFSGEPQQLERISSSFDNHALALTLLTHYLKQAHNGDLTQLDTVPMLLDFQPEGRATRRVLAACHSWLGRTPERALLYLLSLFNRPVSPTTLLEIVGVSFRQRLFGRKHLPKLLHPLYGMNGQKLRGIQQRLHELGLLSTSTKGDMLDLPTSVRAYFFQAFQLGDSAGLSELHETLLKKVGLAQVLQGVEDSLGGTEPAMATTSLQTRLKGLVDNKQWKMATVLSLQLYEAYLQQGDAPTALQHLRQSVAYADLSQEPDTVQRNLALLMDMLQRNGETKEGWRMQQRWFANHATLFQQEPGTEACMPG